MLTLREAVPKAHPLARAKFTTLRLGLRKLGARVTETVSRIRLVFAACPEASLFQAIATTLQPAGPERQGRKAPQIPIFTSRAFRLFRQSQR